MLRALVLNGINSYFEYCILRFDNRQITFFPEDNPVQEQDSYRVEVLIILRHLERLDKDEYSSEERTEAEDVYEQKRQDELMNVPDEEESEQND